MENQTEFDLNHAIQNWRQHLSQSPSYRAENLEELESHLRDSVATLAGKALSDEEAFLIATRRVGATRTLEPEFAKVNGKEVWMNRLLWMLVGVQAWGLINAVSSAFSRTGSQLLMAIFLRPGSDFAGTEQAFLGSPTWLTRPALFFLADIAGLAAVVAGCWWLIQRSESRLSQILRRPGWLVLGVAVLCLMLFGASILNWAESAWMARTVGRSTYGEIVMSMNVASMALFALKTIALAVLTVLLARRQLRRAVA